MHVTASHHLESQAAAGQDRAAESGVRRHHERINGDAVSSAPMLQSLGKRFRLSNNMQRYSHPALGTFMPFHNTLLAPIE